MDQHVCPDPADEALMVEADTPPVHAPVVIISGDNQNKEQESCYLIQSKAEEPVVQVSGCSRVNSVFRSSAPVKGE